MRNAKNASVALLVVLEWGGIAAGFLLQSQCLFTMLKHPSNEGCRTHYSGVYSLLLRSRLLLHVHLSMA